MLLNTYYSSLETLNAFCKNDGNWFIATKIDDKNRRTYTLLKPQDKSEAAAAGWVVNYRALEKFAIGLESSTYHLSPTQMSKIKVLNRSIDEINRDYYCAVIPKIKRVQDNFMESLPSILAPEIKEKIKNLPLVNAGDVNLAEANGYADDLVAPKHFKVLNRSAVRGVSTNTMKPFITFHLIISKLDGSNPYSTAELFIQRYPHARDLWVRPMNVLGEGRETENYFSFFRSFSEIDEQAFALFDRLLNGESIILENKMARLAIPQIDYNTLPHTS